MPTAHAITRRFVTLRMRPRENPESAVSQRPFRSNASSLCIYLFPHFHWTGPAWASRTKRGEKML